VFSEGWDVLQIVLIPYLVETADDWGLVKRNDALFAAALNHPKLPVTADDIADRLGCLMADGVLLPYSVGGQDYLAITKVQDYQGRKYFSKRGPLCPLPPLSIFRQLSEKTRQTFGECAEKLPRTYLPAVAVAVAVAVAGAVAEGQSTHAPGCPFCRRPTKGPLQHYHDEAKSVLKRCLVIPPAKAGPAIARIEAAIGKERSHALFAAYLASEDPFVLKQGHSLLTFASESIQNGLAAALDAGVPHGAVRSRPGASRRPAPARADQFTQTGEVKL
jgi:hypothetical protein